MKKLNIIEFLLFLVCACLLIAGCETRFEVFLDSSDKFIYISGGAFPNYRSFELEIYGDGKTSYVESELAIEGDRKRKEIFNVHTTLNPNETKQFFQGIVNTGVFDLKEYDYSKTLDIAPLRLVAEIDGHKIENNAGNKEIWELMQHLIERLKETEIQKSK